LPIETVLLRQSGNTRDDLSAYEARIGERPVCHPAGDGFGLGGVVFSRLSKLLNQEDALSAPCLCVDFCFPQARRRGAQECCGQA
jgi:hypothetical protein